jgi:hypothetical protein
VSEILSEIIRWVRERNCHLWLVAHPSKMQKNKDGKLPIPTPHDVSGSAHFWNKADNCITVSRNQSDYTDPEVQIHVQKVRFKHIGHIGVHEASLRYEGKGCASNGWRDCPHYLLPFGWDKAQSLRLLRHQRFRFCFLPVLVTKKSENQAKAPLCAAFVEGMREVFGEVTVLYVKEGDFELSESSAGRAEVSSSSSEARPVAGPK